MAIRVHSNSAEQTRALAAAVAEFCLAGDLLVLTGDLGAGKTAFTQGLGLALGVDEPITSPTFTIAREYEGRLMLHHLDVYRLTGPDEAEDLGLDERLDGATVTVIEWGEIIRAALPPDLLEVRLTYGEGDDDRVVELAAVGAAWEPRLGALTVALGRAGVSC